MQSETAAKLELWFFRDMLESNRLRLFELFGFKPSEMDTMAKQQMVFRRILDALSTDAEPVATKLRMIVSHATMGQTDGEGLSTNDICVKITALRNELFKRAQATAPSVAVKALEWEAHGDGWRGCGSIIYEVYPVAEGEGWWAALSMAGYLPFRERCQSPEAAMAAAQADYEARILSALTAQVQDVAGLDADDYYGNDPAELKRLLAQRDKWLVDNDHWHDFTRSIPAAPAKQEGGHD